jgi:hypothetical protein
MAEDPADAPGGRAASLRSWLQAAKLTEVRDLREQVQRLEAEVQECRALNVRLAELTDVVTELLLPVAARDEARLAELLEKYRQSV